MKTCVQIAKIAELSAVIVAALLLAPDGLARAEEWVVVPSTTEDDVAWTESMTKQLADELRKHEIAVRSPTDAARDFENDDSRPAALLTDQNLETWTEESRQALRDLARKDYADALVRLERAQTVSRSAVDELNRDPERAERLLDTCLYTVRALLGLGRRAEAQAQAEECARLSLHAKPNALMHPPDLRAFYEAIVHRRVDEAATLAVEADRTGCDVIVNGLLEGRTPRRIERLVPGPYEVQVECDEQRGRVHRVDVGPGTTELLIDTRFDGSIRSDDGLRLRYASWPDADERLSDAARIARSLRLDVVVLLVARSTGPTELWATNASGQPHAIARLASTVRGPAEGAIASAAEALASGRCLDLTEEPARAVSCRTGLPQPGPQVPEKSDRSSDPPKAQFIAGVTLASLGTASLLASYALSATASTRDADQMIALPSNENQARWLNTRSGMYYTGSAGAALLVTAMPLALPYRAKTPWWAWLCGGAGVALAATSITLAVTAPSEPDASRVADPQGYVDRAKRIDPAFATGVTAAPLLTVPLVYLLRRDEKRTRASLAPQMVVTRAGGFFAVEGRY